MADVAVRGAELFSVKLPEASQHNFSLSEDGFDLSRECDQILEFASAGPKCHNSECHRINFLVSMWHLPGSIAHADQAMQPGRVRDHRLGCQHARRTDAIATLDFLHYIL